MEAIDQRCVEMYHEANNERVSITTSNTEAITIVARLLVLVEILGGLREEVSLRIVVIYKVHGSSEHPMLQNDHPPQ